MQPPPKQKSGIVETLSRPTVVLLRYLFFVLIFYFLLSVAAGLFMPGQEYGRYALLTEPLQSCAELERDLAPFNVNQVEFRIEPAAADEFAPADGTMCWLELAGVSEDGVSPAAAPLYRAARERTAELLHEERFYQPRHGGRETQLIWLLSLVLGAIVLARRLRRKSQPEEN